MTARLFGQNGRVRRKLVIILTACSLAWVVGATLFYASGGLNPAGIVPTLGSALALWGAVQGDSGLIWAGTAMVGLASVLFVFSLGLVIVPAAFVLVVAAITQARLVSPDAGLRDDRL